MLSFVLVGAGRIAVIRPLAFQHRLGDGRVERRRGTVIEVNRGHETSGLGANLAFLGDREKIRFAAC